MKGRKKSNSKFLKIDKICNFSTNLRMTYKKIKTANIIFKKLIYSGEKVEKLV